MKRAWTISLAGAAWLALAGAALAQAGREDRAPQDPAAKLHAYVQVWSRDGGVTPATMREFYAPRVIYYGKAMSREQALRDKLNYIRAWPARTYSIQPGSATTRCTPQGLCEARAVLLWDRTSRAGRRTSGASRLTLVFSQAEGGRIVRESAVTLR
jgi:hypothetical protein